jgi:hypothetical protein
METKHKLASALAPAKLQLPYQEMTSAIRIMLDRVHLQYDGFTRWVQSPQTAVDVRRLDKPELSAIDRAVKALNDLIKKAGLTHDEWMDLNQEAFNSVRTYLGLVPLDRDVFRSRLFRGTSGERVRFFWRLTHAELRLHNILILFLFLTLPDALCDALNYRCT